MKLLSFLISITLHVVILAIFLFLIKTPVIHTKSKVYNVELVALVKPKPKIVKHKQITQQVKKKKVEKPKPKPKPKHKPKPKLKPKKKPKKKIVRQKIAKKRENKPKKKNLNKVYSELLKQKIEQLKKKIEQQQREKEMKQLRQKLIEQKIALLKERLRQKILEGEKKEEVANSYIQLIKGIIDSNWGVEKSLIKNKNYVTKIYIKLDFRGDLIYKRIVESSGNSYFDGTIMEAIQKSAPFPKPPPEILDNGFVEFVITFKSEEKK